MALFKIKKGVKANLPTSYVEGYCYFTTDDGKFYIDTSNAASGRICLNAGMADKLTSNAGSATQPVYFSGGKPVAITLKDTCNNLLNALDTGSSTPVDADYYISQYVSGGNTTTTYHRRPMSALYSYIKGKAEGTWGISITGNAATASSVAWGNVTGKPSSYTPASHTHSEYAAASHTHNYLPLGGGTMDSGARISHGGNLYIGTANNAGWIGVQDICSQDSLGDGKWSIRTNGNAIFQTCKGAVWNDYAEYRESDITEPGRCIIENGDDTLSLSTKRLQRGCEIVSDTFGFAIGETDKCKTPIAAAGRVLAYPYEDREEFRKHIGWPVCSGPNGTVSIMTEEEEEKYPSRIIGTISAIPDYKTWGSGNVEVKNRVWIKVK